MSRPPKAVSEYMAKLGKKGGEATGAAKKRSTAHYKRAAAKRWAKKKSGHNQIWKVAVSKHAVRIKFWDGGIIGGWTCAVEIDGKTYPVSRTVGDGTGAGVPVAFDSKAQARAGAIAEARRILSTGHP